MTSPRRHKWPWFLRVLYWPEIELDLLDDTGNIDHGKAVGFLAFVVFIVLMVSKVIPASVGLVIVLIAAIYGQRVFIAMLRSRAVTSHEEVIDMRGERPEARDVTDPDDVE